VTAIKGMGIAGSKEGQATQNQAVKLGNVLSEHADVDKDLDRALDITDGLVKKKEALYGEVVALVSDLVVPAFSSLGYSRKYVKRASDVSGYGHSFWQKEFRRVAAYVPRPLLGEKWELGVRPFVWAPSADELQNSNNELRLLLPPGEYWLDEEREYFQGEKTPLPKKVRDRKEIFPFRISTALRSDFSGAHDFIRKNVSIFDSYFDIFAGYASEHGGEFGAVKVLPSEVVIRFGGEAWYSDDFWMQREIKRTIDEKEMPRLARDHLNSLLMKLRTAPPTPEITGHEALSEKAARAGLAVPDAKHKKAPAR